MNSNIIAGWAARGIVVLFAFANTRLLIDAVGTEGLAAYSIIISLTPWLALLNLGLPITIQNAIAISRGNEADYIKIRDHSFGTMIVQALLLLPITLLFAYFTHGILLVNYPFVSLGAVIGTHLFIYVTCICQLLAQVMYAEHDAFWPNIYPAFAPIWTTITLATARHFEVEQFNLIILVVAASNILMPLHAARRLKIFSRVKFNLQIIWEQLASSKHQMLFATMAAATLSVDYVVMSRILSAAEIVEYNLASRLFLTLMVVHGVVLATNWTPMADLMHAAKKNDARRHLGKILKQGLLIATGSGVLIVAAIDPMAQLLTGGVVNAIPLELCLAFFVYILLRVWTDTFAMAIQGYGMVYEINKFIPLQALISATCQYFLGLKFGATGIVLGLIASFLLTAAWIIPRKFYSITGK
jgi:hypothetical protein